MKERKRERKKERTRMRKRETVIRGSFIFQGEGDE